MGADKPADTRLRAGMRTATCRDAGKAPGGPPSALSRPDPSPAVSASAAARGGDPNVPAPPGLARTCFGSSSPGDVPGI